MEWVFSRAQCCLAACSSGGHNGKVIKAASQEQTKAAALPLFRRVSFCCILKALREPRQGPQPGQELPRGWTQCRCPSVPAGSTWTEEKGGFATCTFLSLPFHHLRFSHSSTRSPLQALPAASAGCKCHHSAKSSSTPAATQNSLQP